MRYWELRRLAEPAKAVEVAAKAAEEQEVPPAVVKGWLDQARPLQELPWLSVARVQAQERESASQIPWRAVGSIP